MKRLTLSGFNKGFTLIELLVAVAVVGILAVIAIPSYSSYVVKSNRALAQAFMTDVEGRQKQYLLDARRYTTSFTDLGVSAPAEISGLYSFSIAVSATPPAFMITASPVIGTRQENDGVLTLTDSGAKTHGSESSW